MLMLSSSRWSELMLDREEPMEDVTVLGTEKKRKKYVY